MDLKHVCFLIFFDILCCRLQLIAISDQVELRNIFFKLHNWTMNCLQWCLEHSKYWLRHHLVVEMETTFNRPQRRSVLPTTQQKQHDGELRVLTWHPNSHSLNLIVFRVHWNKSDPWRPYRTTHKTAIGDQPPT